MWYHISEPTSYLAITGAGIDTVKIAKKAFVFPWQKVAKLSIVPFDFSLSLQAMTIEKLSFALPAVFTIGPEDDEVALMKYATLLTGRSGTDQTKASADTHVQSIVKGIIEGETRVIVSSMSMEEIFKERQLFKQKVIQNVQTELSQFGLKIYNANVKELQDTPGNEYFSVLSRKAHEGALNTAKIDVAEARMKGEIGERERQGLTKQQISKIEADTSILETERKKDKAAAEASLTTKQTELDRDIQLAKIAAKRAAEARDAELQRDVETKRAHMELERLRATDVTQAMAAKETARENTDANYYNLTKNADAELYRQQKEAEAQYFRSTKEAEAAYYAKAKEAEGLVQMAQAYSHLAEVMGGGEGLLRYLMLEKGVYQDMARANADAIRGLQPKINVWNTGAQGETGGDPTGPIRNLFQCLPPLLSTINDQTGMTPPPWLAGLGTPGDASVSPNMMSMGNPYQQHMQNNSQLTRSQSGSKKPTTVKQT